MTQLINVASWSGEPRGHVIFIHGLGGHAYDTWRLEQSTESFWPLWIARDLKGVTVWTLDYAAPPTNWLGNALPLQDRAVSVLERLLLEPRLADNAPITFVCHSLGGLIVKQLLREADGQKGHRAEAGLLVSRVKGVVFYATPHTGSSHASLLSFLRLIAWPSTAATDLIHNDPNLRNLNIWYRNWSKQINHKIYYETQSTSAGTIVGAGSADAGLADVVPIPIEADHMNICKPAGVDDLGYVSTREFLAKKILNDSLKIEEGIEITVNSLPSVRRTKPNTWVPIILRFSVLIAIGVIAFQLVEWDSITQILNGDNGTQIGTNEGVINIGEKDKSQVDKLP